MEFNSTECKDALQLFESKNVRFVNIMFSDYLGEMKSVEIPVERFEDAARKGVSFDGSSIPGYAEVQDADMYLIPDLSTVTVYPWHTQLQSMAASHGTAGVMAQVHATTGEPSPSDPRYVLKRLMEAAAREGLEFCVGPEPEFFLFAQGKVPATPSDVTSTAGYFALVPDDVEELTRKEIVASLIEMGIPVEKSHHEIHPHIHEVCFKYSDPLTTADRLMLIKFAAKTVAAKHGLQAVFMPKPISHFAAAGMHLNLSVFRESRNLFYDPQDGLKISTEARQFIGGLFRHLGAVTAFTNPTINSYKRLVPGFEAPVNVAWATKNRSALVRIPSTPTPEVSTRIELRSPDPSANPYLAFAAVFAAGWDGIQNQVDPPEAVQQNTYRMNRRQKAELDIQPMPTSLGQTLKALDSDEVITEHIGEELVDYFIAEKRKEIAAFSEIVTPWERKQYQDV